MCESLVAQSLPPRLRHTLATHLQANDQQLKTLERGGVVAYSAKTGATDEIMLVGMARIWATPESFVRAYRDIVAFESAPGVTAGRKFSSPPNDSDMSELVLSKAEVEDLKACRPGRCGFKIGDPGLKFLRDAVNWNSPDYVQQATKALRSLWLQYLIRYQTTGDKGLAVYHDTSKYFSVEKVFMPYWTSPLPYGSTPPGCENTLTTIRKRRTNRQRSFSIGKSGSSA